MTEIDKTYSELRKPLPKEAIKPHPTKAYLSTINPAYVIDRLNNGVDSIKFVEARDDDGEFHDVLVIF